VVALHQVTTTPAFLRVGNHPATDLCNTRPVIGGAPVELLPDVDAVVAWMRLAGVADVADPGADRTRTLRFVHRVRAALRDVLEGGGDAAVRVLNEVVADQRGALHVDTTAAEPVSLTAASAGAQLRLDLTSAVLDIFRYDLDRVRRCANPACVLLFLDVSKSGRRRWCDMAGCGNRAKAAAHYARTRDKEGATS
jgi:predicted RNA-binding Zn ribbon-like protein